MDKLLAVVLVLCFSSVCSGNMIGMRGQKLTLHPLPDSVYNLITHPSLQVNVLFSYLSSGRCPVINRETHPHNTVCWTHPGSYETKLSIQHRLSDGVVNRLIITAGNRHHGFSNITFNGKEIHKGHQVHLTSSAHSENIETHTSRHKHSGEQAISSTHSSNSSSSSSDSFSFSFTHSHRINVRTPMFAFPVDNSDHFVVEKIIPLVPLSSLNCHGLYGQTSVYKEYEDSELKYLEGVMEDYMVLDGDILGTTFGFNQFHY